MSRCCLLDYFFVKRCFIFSIMQANTQIAHNVNRMGRIPNTINKTTYPKSITVTNNDNVIRRILRFRIAIALKKNAVMVIIHKTPPIIILEPIMILSSVFYIIQTAYIHDYVNIYYDIGLFQYHYLLYTKLAKFAITKRIQSKMKFYLVSFLK